MHQNLKKKKSDKFSYNMSFTNYSQLSDIPNSFHIIREVYCIPELVFKSRKIGNILFHHVFQKKKIKGIYWVLFYIFHTKKHLKKNLRIFLKYEFQKLLPIKQHPKIMSCYQGSIMNTWHDFQISKNRQYIISSGFLKTNSKEYTDVYCIFSTQKNQKKKNDKFS